MSLSSPHPIWTKAGSPFEVKKAVISARMLSGRYRTDRLTRFWSKSNPRGLCRLPGCTGEEGSIQHILLFFPALAPSRTKQIKHWSSFLVPRPWLFPVVAHYTLGSPEQHLQFLLDPSTLPLVISSSREHPDILRSSLYLSRTWNFVLYLEREKTMKQWNLTN